MGRNGLENVPQNSRFRPVSAFSADCGFVAFICVYLFRPSISDIRGKRLGRPPNWKADLASIKATDSKGTKESGRVISDLWWVKDGVDHYMSIKTVKPNIDQSAEAKRDLLKLKLNDPKCKVYYGLYYNPYGAQREDYAWSPPMGVFDFHNDPVVLIGKGFWDTLGGAGFYEKVLAIAEDVGTKTRLMVGALKP